jgi:sugar lactone lactonase YvrE
VDTDGNLWVADHPGAKTMPTPWAVFTTEGRLLGTVTMPEGFRVREIGSNYVLGQKADDTEIEHIVLYQLIKPS